MLCKIDFMLMKKDGIMTVLPILKIALIPFSASGDVNVNNIWQDNFQTGSGSIYGNYLQIHMYSIYNVFHYCTIKHKKAKTCAT